MIWLAASDEFTYGGVVRHARDVFECCDTDGRILLAVGRCKPAATPAEKVAEVTIAAEHPSRRRYFRRDRE